MFQPIAATASYGDSSLSAAGECAVQATGFRLKKHDFTAFRRVGQYGQVFACRAYTQCNSALGQVLLPGRCGGNGSANVIGFLADAVNHNGGHHHNEGGHDEHNYFHGSDFGHCFSSLSCGKS